MILMAAFLSLLFIGCTPPKGEPVEFSKACDRSNDQKVIEVKGFLDDDGSVFCSNTGGPYTCGFKLKKKSDGNEKISTYVEVGNGANSVEKIERGYTREDIKIRNNEGNVIDLSKKVTVTGTLKSWEDKTSPEGGGCFLNAAKIE